MEPPLIAPKVDERSKHDDEAGEVIDLALDVVDEVVDDDPCATCAAIGDALDCSWALDAGSCAVDGCGSVVHGCGSVAHDCGSLADGLHCTSVFDGCGSLVDGLHCASGFDVCHVADCDPGCW